MKPTPWRACAAGNRRRTGIARCQRLDRSLSVYSTAAFTLATRGPARKREPSNLVPPEQLNPLDQRILKEAFRQAQRLQRKLAGSYQL